MITFNTVLVKGNDPKYGFVAALCVESDGKVFNSRSCWGGGWGTSAQPFETA